MVWTKREMRTTRYSRLIISLAVVSSNHSRAGVFDIEHSIRAEQQLGRFDQSTPAAWYEDAVAGWGAFIDQDSGHRQRIQRGVRLAGDQDGPGGRCRNTKSKSVI